MGFGRMGARGGFGSLGLVGGVSKPNLLLRPFEFDNAAWLKSNVTVAANATTAPDGTTTADKIVEDSTTSTKAILQTILLNSSVVNVAKICLKAAGRTTGSLVLYKSVASFDGLSVSFDLSAGTIGTPAASAGASGVFGGIETLADGWYRVRVGGLINQGTTNCNLQINLQSGSYLGDGTSGFYAWGAEVRRQ